MVSAAWRATDAMKEYYSTKEAAEITGASRQIIRTYTGTYQKYFSTEGAPDQPGQPRRFTVGDLKLIRFIYVCTSDRKLTHEQVQDRLAAGELEQFDWQPPEQADAPIGIASAAESAQTGSAMLVPIERLQLTLERLTEAQQREAAAAEEITALQERINELQRELGKAEGALSAYQAMQRKPPAWWRSLFGGQPTG